MSELQLLVRAPLEPLRALEKEGVCEVIEREVLRSPYPDRPVMDPDPELTEDQQETLDELLPALRARRGAFLLHGVTGAGKTEVYIRAVRETLRLGRGAIVLVPEIVLTPQMVQWFRGRFRDEAAVLHSRLSAGERFDEWRRIRHGAARVVIGARSAVFAPVKDLGLIIVDEEHESSYVSDRVPAYDAREVAQRRAEREGACLLLASATPSILSFAKAKRGDYTLLEMPLRVNGMPMPEVTVVDMREELRLGNKGMFSGELLTRLEHCLKAGQQAMLFINRRGYAQSVVCRKCGHAMGCPSCDVSLTYHAADNLLHCHYCGQKSPMPPACPECGVGLPVRDVKNGVMKCSECNALQQACPSCDDGWLVERPVAAADRDRRESAASPSRSHPSRVGREGDKDGDRREVGAHAAFDRARGREGYGVDVRKPRHNACGIGSGLAEVDAG